MERRSCNCGVLFSYLAFLIGFFVLYLFSLPFAGYHLLFLLSFQPSLFFFDVMLIIFGAPSVAFSNSPPSSLALPSIYHLPFHCV